MKKARTVSNCHECPFANNDGEHGIENCNLDTDISSGSTIYKWNELPKDKVHDDCPLKKGAVTIMLMP